MHFEQSFMRLLNDIDNDRDRYYGSLLEKYASVADEDCDVIDLHTLTIVKNEGSVKKLANRSFGFVTNYKSCSEIQSDIKVLKKEIYNKCIEKCDEDAQSASSDEDAQSASSDENAQSASSDEDAQSASSDEEAQSASDEDVQSVLPDNEIQKEKKQIQQRYNTKTKSLTNKGKEISSPSGVLSTALKNCFVKLKRLDSSLVNDFKETTKDSRNLFPEFETTLQSKNSLTTKFDKLSIKTDKKYSELIVKSMKYSETEITLRKKVSLNPNCISNNKNPVSTSSLNSSSLYEKCKSGVNPIEKLKCVKKSYQNPDDKDFPIDMLSKKSQINSSNNNNVIYQINNIKPHRCVSDPNEFNLHKDVASKCELPNGLFYKSKLSLQQPRTNDGYRKLLIGNVDNKEDLKSSKVNLEFLKLKMGNNFNSVLLGEKIPYRNFGTLSKSVSSFSSFNSKCRQDKYVNSSSFKIRKESVYTEENYNHAKTFTSKTPINKHGLTSSQIKTLPCPTPSFRQKPKNNGKLKGIMFESLM